MGVACASYVIYQKRLPILIQENVHLHTSSNAYDFHLIHDMT